MSDFTETAQHLSIKVSLPTSEVIVPRRRTPEAADDRGMKARGRARPAPWWGSIQSLSGPLSFNPNSWRRPS